MKLINRATSLTNRRRQDTDRLERRLLERRAFIQGAAFLATGALAGQRLRPARAQAKLSQDRAEYQTSPNEGQKCADCRHFIAEQGACRLVKGSIQPNGWCTQWTSGA